MWDTVQRPIASSVQFLVSTNSSGKSNLKARGNWVEWMLSITLFHKKGCYSDTFKDYLPVPEANHFTCVIALWKRFLYRP